MEHLYAPWRGTYARNTQKPRTGCPFCVALQSTNDHEQYVIHRFKHTLVMLNAFPYNPGHVLIVPNKHCGRLADLNTHERCELIEITNDMILLTEKVLQNNGVNVGFNLGHACAGGSIPEHLHMHIVPRWTGDTGFLPVIAQTKPLSEDLNEVYKRFKASML